VRVALVCKKLSSEFGGLEKYTLFLCRELVRAGHEIHVFANLWEENADVAIHPVTLIPFSSPLKNLSFAYAASRALLGMEFDVVHSMERILHQDIFRVSDGINPVQLLQRYSNPKVRWFKSKGPRRLVLDYLERRIFLGGGCKVVMANSALVKRQIIEHYGVPPERVVVIPNGVDVSRFHPGVKEKHRGTVRKAHGLSEEDLVVLFVSNDFKLKGLRLVLEAMTLMATKNVKLIVMGRDNSDPYERFSRENGLGGRVLFLGPSTELEMYYGASDAFVLPTLYDAFANVCLEAMAAGLPVITSADNGAAELIQDGVTGYVLQTRAPQELANRINDLQSPEARLRMGREGARIAKTYTPERHMSEVLELYGTIVSAKRP